MHCQCNESVHRREQLESRINTIPQNMLILFTFAFAKRHIQCKSMNANQEVSNTNHFGSVFDSLGRLVAASECIASVKMRDISMISLVTMMCLNLIQH